MHISANSVKDQQDISLYFFKMLIRVRTNVGLWRVPITSDPATVTTILDGIKSTRPNVEYTAPLCSDPGCKVPLDESGTKTLSELGLENDSMIYTKVVPETCAEAKPGGSGGAEGAAVSAAAAQTHTGSRTRNMADDKQQAPDGTLLHDDPTTSSTSARAGADADRCTHMVENATAAFAAMLRTTTPSQLRARYPWYADCCTDDEVETIADQVEAVASNPEEWKKMLASYGAEQEAKAAAGRAVTRQELEEKYRPKPEPACPLCFIPLPVGGGYLYQNCCGQFMCSTCAAEKDRVCILDYTRHEEKKNMEAAKASLKTMRTCPFCREEAPKNKDESIARNERLVERNPEDLEALHMLAAAYKYVLHDDKKAFETLLRASDMGCAKSSHAVASYYMNGAEAHVVETDHTEAKKYYERAAKAGYVPAITCLGELEYEALNFQVGVDLFHIAASAGHEEALDRLKSLYKSSCQGYYIYTGVNKEDLADTLRAFQSAQEKTWNEKRDKASKYNAIFGQMKHMWSGEDKDGTLEKEALKFLASGTEFEKNLR